MMHPGLAEPRTKEEWREYLTATPPPAPDLPSHAEYLGLSEDTRARLNRARHAHHSAGVIVRSPRLERLHYELRRRLDVNRHQPAGARRGKVVDGRPTLGKSTAVKMFAADYENELRRVEPDRFTTDDGELRIRDYTPVVYISVVAQATPKDLSISIAEFLGEPYRTGATKTQITHAVLRAMRITGVELVIIDDTHFLDLSVQAGRIANDHLKYLANHTAATFVYTGVELEASGLFLEGGSTTRATQTSGRNDLHKLTPFGIATPTEAREWAGVVASMEQALLLYRHLPGTLAADHWRYLHERTGGSIASLSTLIRESAIEATNTGVESITRDLMDRIILDIDAERRYRATIKTRARRKSSTTPSHPERHTAG